MPSAGGGYSCLFAFRPIRTRSLLEKIAQKGSNQPTGRPAGWAMTSEAHRDWHICKDQPTDRITRMRFALPNGPSLNAAFPITAMRFLQHLFVWCRIRKKRCWWWITSFSHLNLQPLQPPALESHAINAFILAVLESLLTGRLTWQAFLMSERMIGIIKAKLLLAMLMIFEIVISTSIGHNATTPQQEHLHAQP